MLDTMSINRSLVYMLDTIINRYLGYMLDTIIN